MRNALEGAGILVSTGSACASHKKKVSSSLRAMGLTQEQADGTIRVSLGLDNTMEDMDFPKAFTVTRTFSEMRQDPTHPPQLGVQTGKQATFALRILFRQNASWQGSVTWLEGKKEQSFRSALELVLLMHSALTA